MQTLDIIDDLEGLSMATDACQYRKGSAKQQLFHLQLIIVTLRGMNANVQQSVTLYSTHYFAKFKPPA